MNEQLQQLVRPPGIADVHARIAELRSMRRGPDAIGGRFGAMLAAQLSPTMSFKPVAEPSAGATDPSALGERAVALAAEQLGKPYVWGGEDPSGFDCSGLVQHVFGQLGIDVPRVSIDQSKAGQRVESLADARPGDLVFFGSPVDHVGIYAGNGQMIVAPHRGAVVRYQPVGSPVAIRRVTGEVDAKVGGGARAVAAALQKLFADANLRYGLPDGLLSAVAKAESNYRIDARSPAGALGVMQFMPATAAGLGVDPFDPASAIDGAGRLLSGHLQRFGSVELALAAYNAGPGAVTRYGGVPPFAETQGYIRRVTSLLGAAS